MRKKHIICLVAVVLLFASVGTVYAYAEKTRNVNVIDDTVIVDDRESSDSADSKEMHMNYAVNDNELEIDMSQEEKDGNSQILDEDNLKTETAISLNSWDEVREKVPFPVPVIDIEKDGVFTFYYSSGSTENAGDLTAEYHHEQKEIYFIFKSYVGANNWSSAYSFNGEVISDEEYISNGGYKFEVLEIEDNLLEGMEERTHIFALIAFENYEVKMDFYNVGKDEVYQILNDLDLSMYE